MKHKLRWPLDFEVCTLGGISIQYLIAPAFARWLSGVEVVTGAVVTDERWSVRDGHVGGMVIALVFAACFMLGILIFERLAPPAAPTGQKRETLQPFSRADFLFCCIFVPLSWGSRAVLMARGAYYSINRTDFQFTSPLYSALTQIDSLFSAVLTAYAFRCFLIKPSWKWPALAYLIAEFGWHLISGGRERALAVLMVVVLTYVLVRRRVPWKTIVCGCIAAIFLVGIMDYYRYALRQTTLATEFDVGGIQAAWETAAEQATEGSRTHVAARGVMRLSDLDSIAAIYLWVPSLVPFQNGETYWTIPAALVPRVIWPNKPTTTTPINAWMFQDEGGSSPITIMGEGYLNFGWYGVAVAGLVCGGLLALVQRGFFHFRDSAVFVPLFAAALVAVARLHTQPMAIYVAWSIKTTGLLILTAYFVASSMRSHGRSKSADRHSAAHSDPSTGDGHAHRLAKLTRRDAVRNRFARQRERRPRTPTGTKVNE
jgi:hypothetical protein